MHRIVAKSARSLALTLALAALASPAQVAASMDRAPVMAPDALLRSVAEEVIGRIKFDTDLQAGDPAKVADLVEAKILPLFDFGRMTQSAMARNWHRASPAQQAALITEFKTLLVRTYSSALTNYRDETIEFKRLRASPGDSQVRVKSEVTRTAKERMSLDYDMEKTPAGWRIFDVQVAGVCLVTTYRDAFAEKVRESGVEGLIKWLSEMNRQGDSRFSYVKASLWKQTQLVYAIFRSMLQRQ